jgi:rubrerythrin
MTMKQFELDTIKQAILNEIEGYEFYQMAAEKAHDADTKQAFINLAEEEMKHVSWLKELFVKMQDEDHDKFNLAMVSDPPAPHLYNWDNLDRKDAQSAVSVFGIGMQLEELAIKFYEQARDNTEHDMAKGLYTKLIAWEKVHFEQFAKEYELLKREFWDMQQFAPF